MKFSSNDFDSDSFVHGILSKIKVGLAPLICLGTILFYTLISTGELDPGHEAVRTNMFTGNSTTIVEPGVLMSFTGLHNTVIMDAAPKEFSMSGDKDVSVLEVSELSIRCSDGARIFFKEFNLLVELLPGGALSALQHRQGEEGFLDWLKPTIRSVLRNEFGRENTITMADPSSYLEAGNRAEKVLNELLNPHGVNIAKIVTPRPRFEPEYEKAIEERIKTDNQVHVIASELEAAENRRGRELAGVDQKQNKELQSKRAEYESRLAEVLAEQAQMKQESDSYRIEQIAIGQAALSAAQQESRQLKGALAARLAAKRAEIAAFKSQPVERVMAALAERFEEVTVNVQPYALDAAPSRIMMDAKN